MSSIFERITEDLKTALRAGQSERLNLLRLLVAQLHNQSKEKQAKAQGVLSETEVVATLRREIKKREEAARLFRQGQREDLAKKEDRESKYIQEYVPALLGRAEIEKTVTQLYANGLRDFPALMQAAMQNLNGRADGRVVSEVVKAVIK